MLSKLKWQEVDTPAKIEMIRSVYEPGMSSAEIAARIGGVSRNSIIGMYTRWADELSDVPLKPGNITISRKYKDGLAVRPKRAKKIRGGKVSQTRLKPDAIFEAPSGGIPTVGLPLSHLRARQCRFPVNDAERGQEHLFCGAEADGSWCSRHRALVYQPSKKVNATDPALAA